VKSTGSLDWVDTSYDIQSLSQFIKNINNI
jgi:hypothetical protein